MKRVFLCVLILTLLPLCAFASGMPDDRCISGLFVPYAVLVGKATFAEVRYRLDFLGVKYEETIGADELATFYIPCEEGSLYLCFYPLGEKPVFGNPDREYLTCVEYQRAYRWITVSDSIHTREITFETGDGTREPENMKVASLDDLLTYYKEEMRAE